MPRAALADMKTDQDELTAGEKRLLKSIVKTIVGSRGSSMINAANRALETARKKRDVLEIVQVMVYSCQGAARLPYVSDHSGNTRVKRKARQYVNKKASSRGRDFFGADAGMMLESAAARAANRPAPPSRPPPKSTLTPVKMRGMNGLSSVRSLRRQKFRREDSAGPSSSLFSYMGTPTLFQKEGVENK